MRVPLVAIVLFGIILAGCIGGDDVDTPEDEEKVDDAAEIRGSVVNGETLKAVAETRMRLIQENEVIKETHTKENGNFTFMNVEPGQYRLQAFHLRYQPDAIQLSVEPNDVIEENIMLERLRVKDENPYDFYDTWSGTWCGAVTIVQNAPFAPCQSLDENHDTATRDSPDKGLRTLLIGLEWDSDSPTSADELTLSVVNTVGDSYTYKTETGSSPLEIRIDDDDIEEETRKFSYFDDEDGPTLVMSYRVSPTVGVIWQQSFTIHYHYYYWEEGPSGSSAIP